MRFRRVGAAVTAAAVGGVLAVVPVGAAAAAVDEGLVLHYALTGEGSTAAVDLSGSGRDATIVGDAVVGADGLTFDGVDDYVDLPDNLTTGMDAISVSFDVLVDPALSGNHFMFNLGNAAVGNPQSGSGYLFMTNNATLLAKISDAAWGAEQAVTGPAALPRSTWKHVTYTLAEGTGRLYVDGTEVATNGAITHIPADLGDGVTTANYLGRSAYAPDGLFKGKMKDFRLYDRALSVDEVTDLTAANAAVNLAADVAGLSLGDTSAVTADLTLPSAAPGGSAVSWETSDSAVVTAAGVVSQDAPGGAVRTATLTATLTHRGLTDTATFEITVLPAADDASLAQAAADALVVHNLDDVRGNLTLPTTGEHAATVTWASSAPEVIATDGVVVRPAPGEVAAEVTLTATVTVGAAVVIRELEATVPPLPAQEDYEGYLFSYFVGEGTADGEQVYFGLSQGNDPLSYQNLNDNEPVLTSTLGEQGLRDPFIIRSPEGDKFYQIATDLRIYDGNGWDAAQRQGSRSIMVWESTDLVSWTDQRLVQVSPETAGNTWAPEAYYDESIGEYVVFWASKLYAEDDPGHTGDSYNRMMFSTTRDFHTFSEPQIWIDPGYSVIDSTVTEHDGSFYRFTKDERNSSSTSPCSKFITAEKSTELRSTDYELVTECIGAANSLGVGINQGEGPTTFKSNTEEKWYLFIDEYGGRGYVPFETTDLDAAEWTMSTDYQMPARPRHGTVLPVTQAEHDRLLTTYQPDAFVESVENVAILVQVDDIPVLPATVTAQFADGSTRQVSVTWDAIDPEASSAAGEFTVEGTVEVGNALIVQALVTVTDDDIPVESVTVMPESLELGPDGVRQLTATVEPANATHRQVTWSVADPAVASVSATGLVTAVGVGATTVHVVTADDVERATIAVEVTEEIPGLTAWYELDETSGTVVTDSSGNGNDAAVLGEATWNEGEGFRFSGGGSSSGNAIELPDNLIAGHESVTVALDVWIDPAQATPYFIYGFGNTSGGAGDGYFFTTGNGYRTALTNGSWQGEQNVRPAASYNLARGTWKHLTYTQTGTTGVLYEDGVEVARNTDVTVTPASIGDGVTTANWIGRSLYTGDQSFRGVVRDFRLYDRALAPEEVAALGVDPTKVTDVELDELKVPAIIDEATSRIVLPVVPGTDVSALSPRLVASDGSTVAPVNGSVQDFTEPVVYTLSGPDGVEREWTVEAKVMNSPVLPGYYADPNVVRFGDTYYIYATTDGFAGWSGSKFEVWSSQDLVTWTNHGEILDLGPDVTWAESRAWAPAAIEKNGKYYFYFSADQNIGVAVADSPTGPFTEPLGVPLVNKDTYGGAQQIDPAVFTDSDGQSYLYWGNGNAYVVPLNEDMTSYVEAEVERITGLTDFREGLFMHERNGTYYLSWSIDDTRSENYRVGYATGPSPTGPWTNQGLLLEKDPSLGIKGTGHHSIVEVSGTDEWYIVYHRFAISGGDGTHRETTIDHLYFAEDGTMVKVVPTLESIEPLDLEAPDTVAPVASIELDPVAPESGWHTGDVTVTVTATDDGTATPAVEVRVGDGEWASYTGPVVVSGEGQHTVRARATDDADNTSVVAEQVVRIDLTAPEVTATVDEDARTVTLDASDADSGVASIEYRVGESGEWSAYTAPVQVGDEAVTIRLRATDEAGNASAESSIAVEAVEPEPEPEPEPVPDFADVVEGQAFYAEIRWMAEVGLSAGTVIGDATFFLPASPVSRQAMAAFVYRYMGADFTPAQGTQSFTDVGPDHPLYAEIEWMKARGLTDGYADGSFGTTRPVSRQAMAAFLHRLADEPEPSEASPFTDVAGNQFAAAIAWLAEAEISEGYPDGSFGTTKPVTRQAMAAFLHRYDRFVSVLRVAQG